MDGAYLIAYHPAAGLTSLDRRPQEWMVHYNREGYLHFDPIVEAAMRGGPSFTWGDCFGQSKLPAKKKALLLQARDFGLSEGFNCAARNDDYSATTCCYYGSGSRRFWDSMRENKKSMEMIAAAGQQKLASLVAGDADIPSLAPREKECLTWAAVGKTNDEIGTILSLSENTVNGYLRSAATKLGVRSKIHAVAKAIQLKLIHPI